MKTQTKLFASPLAPPKKRSVEKSITPSKKSLPTLGGVATSALIEIAPDLIEQATKQFSSMMAAWSKDHVQSTYIKKNIDGDNDDEIFLPNYLRILRANFTTQEHPCQDDFDIEAENCQTIDSRELQVDIQIKQSRDRDSFYFQPLSYYYKGRDRQNKKIDEIHLSYAFVYPDEKSLEYEKMTFQKIIEFNDLENEHDYSFKNNNHYDTTYQSPWIGSESNKKGPYTIVFKIEEIQRRSKFRQNLYQIYKGHEKTLQTKINKDIKAQLEKLNKDRNTNESNPTN